MNVIFLPNKSLENNGECAVRSTVGVVPALVLRSLHRFLAVFQLIVRLLAVGRFRVRRARRQTREICIS